MSGLFDKLILSKKAKKGVLLMGIYLQRNGDWLSLITDRALKLNTPRTITLTGDVNGSVVFDGSANVTMNTTVLQSGNATADGDGNDISNTYLKRTGGTMTGQINTTSLIPTSNNAYSLGTESQRYANLYANRIIGDVMGNVTGNVQGNVTGNVSGDCGGTAENSKKLLNINCTNTTTAPTGTARLNMDCYLYATRVYNSVFNDYAECFKSSLVYEDVKNRIVSVDENGFAVLAPSESNLVIGVISDTYGHLLGGTEDEISENKKVPVGLAGVVWVQSLNSVKKDDIGKFVISGGDGYAYPVIMPRFGRTVGKIIDVNFTENCYKIIISLM